jgi:DNA-binding response OmpR family regulator
VPGATTESGALDGSDIVRGVDAQQTPPYVLVVEDEGDTRRAITEALTESGLETVAAEDGAIALAICRERDPAVIVLDLKLPRLDGERFIEAYRKLPHRSTTAQILVISALHDAAETAGKIGGRRYLSKPFSLERVVAAVQKLLAEAAT